MITTCPDDDTLAALAFGEEIDPQLRAHADSCPDCRGRLDEMRLGLTTLRNLWQYQTVSLSAAPAPAPVSRPAQIGKYMIVGTLGEGAQAVVYRGLHPTLNKDVVLKLGRDTVDQGNLDRAHLVNEGKVLAMLEHPHLARVVDLDFHDGRPYLVMEYVRGVNLEEYAAGASPTPLQSAALVARLARGLAVAHAAGVVHHDIKPRNVLVTDDGRPVLIDFGLACLRRLNREQMEQAGAPGGTLAYMAPEHACGEVEKIGPHTDLFGLGGVLYFLLTGKALYHAADAFTVQQKAMRCEYDALALDRPGIPAALARLCRQALALRSEDRPGSADEFAAELEKLARPPGPSPSRRRLLVGGLAIGGLAAAGLGVWLWPRPEPPLPAAPKGQELVVVHERTQNGVKKRFNPPIGPNALLTGDQIVVRCEVPRSSHATLYWLDTEGQLHDRDLTPDGEGDFGPRLRYPALTEGLEGIAGPPGTELFLVLCNRSSRPLPDRDELEALLRRVGGNGPWPKLEGNDKLLLHRDRVEEPTRGPAGPTATAYTEVYRRLEELRQELRQTCDWFWGIAIPHL